MDRPKPAEPHQLRDASRVVAVGLDRHRLKGDAHIPGLQQLNRQARLHQRRVKLLPQRPGLQANPRRIEAARGEPADQRFRLAGELRLSNDLPGAVDDAHARCFQRHVDPRIIIHSHLSMMLGADESPTPSMTPSFREMTTSPQSLSLAAARYAIYGE